MQNEYYTQYFCEENVWWLGKSLLTKYSIENMQVLIISNKQQQVPLFYQKKATQENLIIWDYHVILACTDFITKIFDFDSKLPFPCTWSLYSRKTFPNQYLLPKEFRISIRAIPLQHYHNHLHSDRSHMLDKQGNFIAKFPVTPAILSENKKKVTLRQYIDMNYVIGETTVYSDDQIFDIFT